MDEDWDIKVEIAGLCCDGCRTLISLLVEMHGEGKVQRALSRMERKQEALSRVLVRAPLFGEDLPPPPPKPEVRVAPGAPVGDARVSKALKHGQYYWLVANNKLTREQLRRVMAWFSGDVEYGPANMARLFEYQTLDPESVDMAISLGIRLEHLAAFQVLSKEQYAALLKKQEG